MRRLPPKVQVQLDSWREAVEVLTSVRDPRVVRSLAPSGLRGLLLHRGKQGEPTKVRASHEAHFDWAYPHDNPQMAELYRRAKAGQWDGDDLPWATSVDPLNPEVPLLPAGFFNVAKLNEFGVHLTEDEGLRLSADVAAWMLSQFLHGEQGALFAAAQVTEAVQFFDGKFYGATQVMDEARHVEVFLRYLESKLEKLYQVNDNLFVIIDALMADARWDMKFLGMQIMVEGLALGAFGTMYQVTSEPLMREMLRYVIQDEARHVHYGVLALGEHVRTALSESERQEREDWAFEVSLLMRNRFMVYELHEEWFEGILTRDQWRQVVLASPGLELFRSTMFSRLVPNLREIGLLSERIQPAYHEAGLMKYFNGASANELTAESMLAALDGGAAAAK
ncbi:MAG: ferritin-like domain-containing protein [Alphaproteobacteria bacterium]|nr:ferritin-like domain-containing protein [Alphaproteobacteria bacterium]MCB9794258.1 ferritin-like domain-containing protein [Alphaproteobacteria bacterium]